MALDPAAVRRGAVELIRLPRDKARPAVVVRSDLLAELLYATVLPITTEPRAGISLRIDVAPSQENGLRAASQVMVDWPQTVRFSDMGQAIGKLDAATMALSRGRSLSGWRSVRADRAAPALRVRVWRGEAMSTKPREGGAVPVGRRAVPSASRIWGYYGARPLSSDEEPLAPTRARANRWRSSRGLTL